MRNFKRNRKVFKRKSNKTKPNEFFKDFFTISLFCKALINRVMLKLLRNYHKNVKKKFCYY